MTETYRPPALPPTWTRTMGGKPSVGATCGTHPEDKYAGR